MRLPLSSNNRPATREPFPADITLLSALAAPSLPEPFWFLPGCSLLARMQCERPVYHLGFSSAPENRGGRPWSSLLPAIQCVRIPEQAGPGPPAGPENKRHLGAAHLALGGLGL